MRAPVLGGTNVLGRSLVGFGAGLTVRPVDKTIQDALERDVARSRPPHCGSIGATLTALGVLGTLDRPDGQCDRTQKK